MKTLVLALAIGIPTGMCFNMLKMKDHATNMAETYEHLATAIIEIENTEDMLVKNILEYYHDVAQMHLKTAAAGTDAKKEVEAAAEQVANIAQEGDKRVRAIRNRLKEAGHTHNTDTDGSDFMFIDSKERAALSELAGRVGKLADKAGIEKAAAELGGVFEKAMGE